jgi:hypothetical protein
METKNYRFISGFLETHRETEAFINIINKLWTNIFQCIINESDFNDKQKRQYAIDSLYYLSDIDIKEFNENNDLTSFISNNAYFLNISMPNVEKIIAGFSLINVKFTWIEHDISNKDLFMAVYKNNLYHLNFGTISLMLKVAYGLTENIDFIVKNYTLITSKPDEPLAQYVNCNINQYIDIILDNCEERIIDEENILLEILNNSQIDSDNKKKYIGFLQTIIGQISSVIDKELWSLILQEKLVDYSVDNILSYFFLSGNGLDEFLIQFIDAQNDKLKFDYNSINKSFGEDATSKFFNAIVKCHKLSNQRYKYILKDLNWRFKMFSITGIQDEKILLLINLSIIPMASNELLFMRENYPEQLIAFIVKNISKYADDVIVEENFILDEIFSVLEEDLNDKYKIKLLSFTTDAISLKQKTYSDVVKLHILINNLDVNDIPFLLGSYTKESASIKDEIKRISIMHISDILDNKYSIPLELLSELFRSNQLEVKTKKDLFALCLPKMNEIQTKEYLLALQMKDFLSLFNRKRTKFEVNTVNEQILNVFKEKRWITSFNIDKDKPNYYRANGRKLQDTIAIELL